MKKNSVYDLLINPYAILVFLLILFVFNSLNLLLSYDEYLWSYIGRIWNRNGIPPYVGAVENKTPGIFFLYAISDFLFKGNIFFTRITGVIATLFSTWYLFKICSKLHSKLAGVFCMYVFGLTTCWDILDGSYFAHTEVFMVLFSILGFYYIIQLENDKKINQNIFLAGLCIGISISFKQIALTTFVAILVFFLVFTGNRFSIKNKVKWLVLYFLGSLTSISISFLILYFHNVTFHDYLNGAWIILMNSGSKVLDIKTHLSNFHNKLIISRFLIFYFFILLFLFQKEFRAKPFFWGIILWFVLDFAGVNASGNYYGHQIKQVIPALAIIVGIVMSNLVTNNFYLKRIETKQVIIIFIIVIFFFPYKQSYVTLKSFLNTPDSTSEEMGNWIKDHTSKEDYIYLMGGDYKLVSALLASDRVSSSKYFNSIFITDDKQRKVVYSDLMEKTPKFILKIENDSVYVNQVYGSQIEEFLKIKYYLFAKSNGLEIYKLNKNNFHVEY
ncbi:MAG: hypothetical protein ACI9OE_000657 [Mariniflexile sp.]|jgi:hypothetical protein